jgi:hypothetical protein
MRIGPFALAAAVFGAACSLIVQFDPEGQKCGPAGECLKDYRCVGGVCTKGSGDGGTGGDGGAGCAGVVCDTPGPCQTGPGSCSPSTGRCIYPPRPLNSTCTDDSLCTQGDHCDGDGGCVVNTTTACNTPPTACHSDAGTCSPASGACSYAALAPNDRCEDGNPCTVGETCGTGGVCSGGSARVCNMPPSACAAATGSCDTVRGCVYPPAPGVTTCTDNNTCTQGDFCDGGACVPGPSCPPPLPCQVGTCAANGTCTYAAAGDGTSCGANAAQRCCGGNCIDISSSALHCGGCGIACMPGYSCESVALPLACAPFNPTNTSGRCTCDSSMAGTCPSRQSCRGVTPGLNRCEPLDGGCADGGRIQTVASCPSYCLY